MVKDAAFSIHGLIMCQLSNCDFRGVKWPLVGLVLSEDDPLSLRFGWSSVLSGRCT